MEEKYLLIDLQYLPPISYFSKLIRYQQITFDLYEHFVKSTFRNRCLIAGPNGRLMLSIPLERGKHQHRPIRDIKISYDTGWLKNHWYSIQSSYRSSPYFEFYEDELEPVFNKKYEYLHERNIACFTWICEVLEVDLQWGFTQKYESGNTEMDDQRSKRKPVSGHLENRDTGLPRYKQVFEDRNGFLADMSIMDLIFNEGPNSAVLIKQ